jgi:transposase
MPWKECHVMDERLRFVARLLDGEKMAMLCAEFGISRKTGYKIFERSRDCGIDGLTDRSRRPYRHAKQLPPAIEQWIVRLKKEDPRWGAPKIRERLRERCADVRCPAISTVHAQVDRRPGHASAAARWREVASGPRDGALEIRPRLRLRGASRSSRFCHLKCRFAKAHPEPDFRYRSKANRGSRVVRMM